MDPHDPDYTVLPFPQLQQWRPTANVFRHPRIWLHWVVERANATNPVTIQCLRQLSGERRRMFGRNAPRKLDMFPQMHIDIVLEVLRHLNPLDLLHLSRTTREFRALLHEPTLDNIWREAFIKPLPTCPNEIQGRRWAELLFGAYKCEECGRSNTLPDFAILRHLCTWCMNRRLTYIKNLRPSPVHKLIPGTCREDGNNRTHTNSSRALTCEARVVIE
ncbi:hypothetical protein B0H19DRAFT_1103997 [Mycena capillaripes]|nr:hypothetical protein B0H19DRAFT_1103997 [Mycena capillaripes]